MSNEKNMQQPERKKENTTVLEKIRRRTGLLVGIVGLALIIFILESLLGNGASVFGDDEMTTVGSINGTRIDRNEFALKIDKQVNNYRQGNQGREVDDATRTQIVETTWQKYIIDLVMKPQFDKIGIAVGDDELYEAVLVNPVQTIIQGVSDRSTGKVNPQLALPDGSLDVAKWRQAVQGWTGENEAYVRQLEEQVKNTRYFEKFRSLITRGLYVTKAEAKQHFKNNNAQMSVNFVLKRFDSVNDSTIKLTDSELEKYYNEHSFQYTNPETTRKVEYVAFDILPSDEDLAQAEKEAIAAAAQFKGKTPAEDSTLMQMENENGAVIIQNMNKKNMVIRDSSVFTDAPGTVYGPYNEGAYFKVYKLQAINSVADSARVRHILVATSDPQTQQPKRSMAQAKREADSVLVLIRENKVSFDSLVTTFSDDPGSKENGGDYGWWGEEANWVEPFKNAGLMGTKGNISVVETSFGYHIIEVLDVSKTRHNSYRVAQIQKMIAPSEATTQKIFAKANQFAGENTTGVLFDKSVEKQKLTPRLADNLREGDYQVPGLEGAKDLVKWAYMANKGDVSLFTLSDKFVVAKLSAIRNKGVLPFEEVKDEVTYKAKQAKKADILLAEFKSKAANAKSVAEYATKLSLDLLKQDGLVYTTGSVEGVGRDNIIVGTAAGLKQGVVSKPTAGENGVFVLVVNSVRSNPEPQNYSNDQQSAERAVAARSDYEVFNALKDISDIEFHKSRID